MRQALVLAALMVMVAACGATTATGSITVLSDSAVPGVPSTTKSLTAQDLSKDASIPGFGAQIESWGFIRGAERTFQGQSRHLTFVDSRGLVFRDATGAGAYVAFVHDHVTDFFGIGGVQPLVAQGRPGWQMTPSACACHLANPVVIGVVSSGSEVVWLEINGPDATPALLMSLLDPAHSSPAAV